MRYFKLTLITALIHFATASTSQTWLWGKQSKGGGSHPSGTSCMDINKDVYVAGFFDSTSVSFDSFTLTNSGASGNMNGYITKYDNTGSVIWTRSIGGTCWINSICTDAIGNVIVTGATYPSIMSFGTYTVAGGSFFIAKYDGNGNILWARRSAGPSAANYGYSVASDRYNNIFVTGEFNSTSIVLGTFTVSNPTSVQNMFLAKYDSNGNTLWARGSLPKAGSSGAIGNSLSSDSIGNVYVGGKIKGPGAVFDTITVSSWSHDAFIAKYNGTGSIQWVKAFGGSDEDYCNSITTDPNGNSYLTGVFLSSSIAFPSFSITNLGNRNAFVVKYDSNGTPIWARSIGGNYYEVGHSITNRDNVIYVTGRAVSSSILIGTNNLTVPNTVDAMFIARYDNNGNATCSSVIASGGDHHTGLSIDEFGDVYVNSDFIVSPLIFGSDTLVNSGKRRMFLAKFTCIGASIIELTKSLTNLYPNPNTGKFTIEINNPIIHGELRLTDLLGRVISIQTVREGINHISLTNVPNGIYTYQLISNKKITHNGKIVIN
jgi:hypothetical protein